MEVRVAGDERDAEFERERRRGESAKGGTSGGARKTGANRGRVGRVAREVKRERSRSVTVGA